MTRKEEKAELIYKDESYTIIGACFAVYRVEHERLLPRQKESPNVCL
jgi:hypothetical protein